MVKKYIFVWCHFKALFKYYKFCSKHLSIRPSLGGEGKGGRVEGKNIKIYEWHLQRRVLLYIIYTGEIYLSLWLAKGIFLIFNLRNMKHELCTSLNKINT